MHHGPEGSFLTGYSNQDRVSDVREGTDPDRADASMNGTLRLGSSYQPGLSLQDEHRWSFSVSTYNTCSLPS